jgi:hypothetical protein
MGRGAQFYSHRGQVPRNLLCGLQHGIRAMDAVPKRALQGRLEVFGDKGAPRPLSAGDRVKAQYQGNPRHAWYTGTAGALNADGSWRIQYDDMEEEDLHVYRPGSCMPSIMHLDSVYVPTLMPAPDGDVQSRAKGSRSARTDKKRAWGKRKVRHTGFRFMRVDPVAAGARGKRDGLATRMHFMCQEELVRDGKVTRTDAKYITLRERHECQVCARSAACALGLRGASVHHSACLHREHPASAGAPGDGGLECQRTRARGTQFCRVQAGAGAGRAASREKGQGQQVVDTARGQGGGVLNRLHT